MISSTGAVSWKRKSVRRLNYTRITPNGIQPSPADSQDTQKDEKPQENPEAKAFEPAAPAEPVAEGAPSPADPVPAPAPAPSGPLPPPSPELNSPEKSENSTPPPAPVAESPPEGQPSDAASAPAQGQGQGQASTPPPASPAPSPSPPSSPTLSAEAHELNLPVDGLVYRMDEQRRVLEGATLGQVLRTFLDQTPDNTTIYHLVVAHGHFFPSGRLFSAIKSAYTVAASLPGEKAIRAQMGLLSLFKQWYLNDWATIEADKTLNDALEAFLATLKQTQFADFVSSILKSVATKKKARVGENPVDAPQPIAPAPKPGEAYTVLDFDPLEVARQLCLIDFRLLSDVKLSEFHHTNWTKDKSPAIVKANEFTNKLAYYMAYFIVSQPGVKEKSLAWQHTVKIAKHLLELQNFNSLLSFYLALQNPNVLHALESFKKDIPKKLFKDWEAVERHMTPHNNFRHYRNLARQLQPPYIPCFEVHLKDLLYQAEGEPDWLDDGQKVLNYAKLDTMGKIIAVFTRAQSDPFNFQIQLDVYRTMSVPSLNIDELRRLIGEIAHSSRASSTTTTLDTPPRAKSTPSRQHSAIIDDTPIRHVSEDLTAQARSFHSSESESDSLTPSALAPSQGSAQGSSPRPPSVSKTLPPIPDLPSDPEERALFLKQFELLLRARAQDLDQREKALADREKEVARREAALAESPSLTPLSQSTPLTKRGSSKPSSPSKSRSSRKHSSPPSVLPTVTIASLPTERVYTLLLVSAPGAGRSALLNRLVTNTFISLGRSKTDESSPVIDLAGVKAQLFAPVLDLDEPFDNLQAFRSGKTPIDGIVAVYDVSDFESFQNFQFWIQPSTRRIKYPLMVVATRVDDSEREVPQAKGKAFADSLHAALHTEVSAKSGDGVRAAFEQFASTLHSEDPTL